MHGARLLEDAKQVVTTINAFEIDETNAKVITIGGQLINQRENGVYTIQQVLEGYRSYATVINIRAL